METIEELDTRFNQLLEELQDVTQKRRKLQGISFRRTLYPVESQEERRSLDFYHKQQASFWTPHEMNFGMDVHDYQGMSPQEQRLIDLPFAFFSGADADVISELSFRFLLEVQSFPELCFYLSQNYIESVHAETYALLITHLIPNEEKRKMLLEASDHFPVVRSIQTWMEQFMTGDFTPVQRFAAYASVEGIIFQVPFLFIFWFRTQGKMANIIFANEQISKDEGIHADYGCMKTRSYLDRHTDPNSSDRQAVRKIVQEAHQLAKEFLRHVMTYENQTIRLPGLSLDMCDMYVNRVANTVLSRMGLGELFEVREDQIPSWVRDLGSLSKPNFYERGVGNYAQFSMRTMDQEEGYDGDVDF